MLWLRNSKSEGCDAADALECNRRTNEAGVPQWRVFFVMRSRGESMSSIVGYARANARERNSEVQEVELRAIGPVRVFMGCGESRRMKARL